MDRLFELFFGNVLDFFVESQNDASARIRYLVSGVKPAAVGIGENQDLPRLAADVFIQRVLDSAQTFPVNIHITEDVRGKFSLGIKAPAFPLEINSAQIHRRNSLDFVRRQFTRDPREGTRTR